MVVIGHSMDEGRLISPESCAELPDYLDVEVEKRQSYCPSPEAQCWIPGRLSDKDLKQYIRVARSVTALAGICNGGTMEKGIVMSFNDAAAFDALRLLHESKYDSNEALAGMVALPPHKSSIVKWAEEEKRLFEQGIKQFGKHFDKIRREYLPKKNTKEIVEYYYLWKMTPAALNIRYAKKKGSRNNGLPCSKRPKLSADNASSDPGEGSSGSDSPGSESEESNAEDGELVGRDDLTCEHCKTKSSERWRYGGSNKMVLCSPCRLHFKRFGEMPPLSESSLSESSLPGSVKNGGSESETNKSVENNLDSNQAETEKEPVQHGAAPEDEEKDQSGDLLIDDDEEATPVDVVEEQPEEDEEELVDDEAKEEPNKFLTVKFGQNQITFTRPSCRGWDKCSRTDMVYVGREEVKKDTPVAKAERTPIKQEPAPQVYGPGHPGFSPLITPGATGIPGMPGSSLIPGPAAAAASAGVISANGIFNGPQLPTSAAIKPDPMPKIEPGSYAQAKIMELFKQQEAAAKMKMQAEGLYNMPHGLRPPSMAPPSLLPNFPGIRPPTGFDNKMLQGMHPQLQHEQIMEHLEALSRQQAQHQQAVAAQQHIQAQHQQQQHFSAERIQELLKNARTVPDKYLQEQLLEAARSDALARQQQAAAAAHLMPQTPDNPQQASQWARFIEQQALAAAQQHNAAAAAAQHNQTPHGAPPRGFDGLPGPMASALQHHHQQQQQQQQQQQAQLHQQRPQLPHIHQHDKRKRDTPFPFHQLFPIMARRHTVKKHECKLKGEDDEIIFMGSNGGPPHVPPTRTLPSHLPAHLSQLGSGVKPSFSPLQSAAAPHRLPNGSGLPSSQHQLPAGLIPGMNSAHYANLMKVFQNQNILRNQLQ